MSAHKPENVAAPVTSQPVGPTGPAFPAANVTPRRAMGGSSADATVSSSGRVRASSTHDKDMARNFLAGLDPRANKFTFQFFSDRGKGSAEIFHGTLDEVWPKVLQLNTQQRGIAVFVVINETDLKGRKSENIVRPRALFADADNPAQMKSCKNVLDACGATPSMIVVSGRGYHSYFCADNIPLDQFSALQKTLSEKLGTDAAVHDLPRVMRLPGTLHLKNPAQPKLVKLIKGPVVGWNLPNLIAKLGLSPVNAATVHTQPGAGKIAATVTSVPEAFVGQRPAPTFAHLDPLKDNLSAGIKYEETPLDPRSVIYGCPFFRDALATNGKEHSQPLWNLTILAATFWINGEGFAHALGKAHPGYTPASTDAMFARKMKERSEKGLGWPSCKAIHGAGSKFCTTCPHFAKNKSPLNLAQPYQASAAPSTMSSQASASAPASFVDPYSDFAGPAFPLEVLPPTLINFVDAEHRAMGADPSAIAMAALTVVAGAMHAETNVRVGEGWLEKPILWSALIGPPSTMKSPIIDKVIKPLTKIDYERAKAWKQELAIWQQNQKTKVKTSPPPRKPRCIINDVTPEKVAEILSRDPSGSLMVHDELAGLVGSFERYTGGIASRAFYLSCWNGGPFTKDRVGKGVHDPAAEIHVDNLALGVLGGIQPDRLVELRDLTSDGLLQRFLPLLMRTSERGDEYYPVAGAEADYEALIRSVNATLPCSYQFDADALEVRDRLIDHLHTLEKVDGFSTALIGAIGKLKGYFGRISLVLEAARQHDAKWLQSLIPPGFTPEVAKQLNELMGLDPKDPKESLSAGIYSDRGISRQTAEAAEKLTREFLLPHIFGLYDFVVNGGKDRDTLRVIGDFILASNKDRLRPSDITSGVRALRGRPEQTIREWAGRFCAMGWLEPQEEKPGLPTKAWLVQPGLRDHFAKRRQEAQEARKRAHEILKAGGSRGGA
jgi:uncharacterized protein DUF3987